MSEYRSFDSITKDILANENFQAITNESHHGITRMEHSLRVAHGVYDMAIKHNLDYVSATRAALVHDFFTNAEFITNHGLIKGVVHPDIALANARGEFEINEIEANAIEAHMFPLSVVTPKSKEAWTLTFVDKKVAIYEYSMNKFNPKRLTHKVSYGLSMALVFAFNLITMGRR